MARPNLTPIKQTPRVVTQGSLSKPQAQPKPSFQGPLLPTPVKYQLPPVARPA